jgi:hypothetical protein
MRFCTLLKVLKQHAHTGEERREGRGERGEGRRGEGGGKEEGRRGEGGGKEEGRRGEGGGKEGGREGGEWKVEGWILGVMLILARAAGSIFGTVDFGPRSGLDFG